MKIQELIKGVDVGEIGQFSNLGEPHGWWIFKVTPRPYAGPNIGSIITGEFLRWDYCVRCGTLHYDHDRYQDDRGLFPSKKEVDLCYNCGWTNHEKIIGRVIYVVSQVYAPEGSTGIWKNKHSSHDYRVKGFELRKEEKKPLEPLDLSTKT